MSLIIKENYEVELPNFIFAKVNYRLNIIQKFHDTDDGGSYFDEEEELEVLGIVKVDDEGNELPLSLTPKLNEQILNKLRP